jgi:NOL1/NOP2/sun family putative RNA methylase
MQPQDMLPKQFVERLSSFISKNLIIDVLDSFCADKLPAVRTNTLKLSTDELKELFKRHNIEFTSILWYSDAFIITNATTRQLTELQEYKNGFFYIQSLSSMIPALVLNPQQDEKILDLAAAPGSKTTQLAAMMNNLGEIVANDISRERIFKLKDNLERMGVTNVNTRIGPGEKIWQPYPEYFDKTLVDVPCSMEGRIQCNDKTTYENWSVKKIKSLAKQQQWLLRSAISATKPGGTIVYSTCTLAPEENEGVIDWILTKEKDTIQLEPVEISGLEIMPGITQWGEKKYNGDVAKTVRILPSKTMEGFYVAKIKKLQSNVKHLV